MNHWRARALRARVYQAARACALAALGLGALPAFANSALIGRGGGAVAGPLRPVLTRLEVEREELRLRCDRSAERAAECRFEATYYVRNPSAESEDFFGYFYGAWARDITITLDGRRIDRALTAEESAAFDRLLRDARDARDRAVYGGLFEPYRHEGITRHGMAGVVGPGQRTVWRVTGTMRSRPARDYEAWVFHGTRTRHPVLHRVRPRTRWSFDYLLAPVRTFARVGPIHVTVDAPSDWNVTPAVSERYEQSPRPRGAWRTTVAHGRRTSTLSSTAAEDNWLQLDAEVPAGVFEHGGPYVALGGQTGAEGGFRFRGGYEVGFTPIVITGLSIDTDFQRRASLALTVEAALPFILLMPLLPSLGAGIGPALQIVPSVQPGLRFVTTATFPVAGFVFAADWFPAASVGPSGGTDFVQLSFMGRLGV